MMTGRYKRSSFVQIYAETSPKKQSRVVAVHGDSRQETRSSFAHRPTQTELDLSW